MDDEFSKKPKETIAIAGDHAGYTLKQALIPHVEGLGYKVLDLGTDGEESVDYPDFGYAVAEAIEDGRVERGILVCGTGIGVSIAANRSLDVRCGLVHDVTTARLCREHNDANVMALGARIVGLAVAKDCVEAFLKTKFSGDRHARRVEKLNKGKC